eukprot:scaffold18345_cov76-Skeletonema_dohrnii-CCMP3373.AAC.2
MKDSSDRGSLRGSCQFFQCWKLHVYHNDPTSSSTAARARARPPGVVLILQLQYPFSLYGRYKYLM